MSSKIVPQYPGDKVTPAKRLDAVEQLLASCMGTSAIASRLSERYGVTTRTIHADIRKVRERWAKNAEGDRLRRYAENREQLRALVAKSLASKDLTNANRAMRTLCEIDGLIGPGVQVNVNTSPVEVARAMTRQQRQARIDELLAKRNGETLDTGESDAEH